jgi:putative methionine-R-sulfoxide reductase with GAF domain
MDIDIVFKDSVADALNSIGSNEHYIALTDLDANGGDGSGIDTLRNIVDSGVFDWIIAVGDAAARDAVAGEIGLESCAFLLKPIDTDELRQLIESISEVHALRREVTVKTRKLSHLEVINEIARETLRTRDENILLWKIARLVNEKLGYYNVNIFLINEAEDNVVLKAFAGGFGEDLKAGYSLKLGEGITGWVAQNREPLISGDVESDPRRIIGFEFEERVQSELGVPIIVDNGCWA